MIIRESDSDDFVIELDRSELLLLSHAVNEACNGIENWEFSTRVGASRDRAMELLDEIGHALER
jgi:hypothetical protein